MNREVDGRETLRRGRNTPGIWHWAQPPPQRLSPEAWRKQAEPLVTGQWVLSPQACCFPAPSPAPGMVSRSDSGPWVSEVLGGTGLEVPLVSSPTFSLGLPAPSRKPPLTASLLWRNSSSSPAQERGSDPVRIPQQERAQAGARPPGSCRS